MAMEELSHRDFKRLVAKTNHYGYIPFQARPTYFTSRTIVLDHRNAPVWWGGRQARGWGMVGWGQARTSTANTLPLLTTVTVRDSGYCSMTSRPSLRTQPSGQDASGSTTACFRDKGSPNRTRAQIPNTARGRQRISSYTVLPGAS